MAPGERSKSGAPMFEPEVSRKQMFCVDGSDCDNLRLFGAPAVIRRSHSDLALLQ